MHYLYTFQDFKNIIGKAKRNYNSSKNILNDFNPNIVFVGLTAPKQEKWVFENRDKIQSDYLISIGAEFDFFAGTKSDGGVFFEYFHLIWVYRLVTDFRKVWKRTIINIPIFLVFNLFPFFYEKYSKAIAKRK